MNEFRTREGTLDRPYLRVCAIWRLLKSGKIDFAQAKAIADRPVRGIQFRNTVDIWERSRLCRESLNRESR
jgi:hypothetical protein